MNIWIRSPTESSHPISTASSWKLTRPALSRLRLRRPTARRPRPPTVRPQRPATARHLRLRRRRHRLLLPPRHNLSPDPGAEPNVQLTFRRLARRNVRPSGFCRYKSRHMLRRLIIALRPLSLIVALTVLAPGGARAFAA